MASPTVSARLSNVHPKMLGGSLRSEAKPDHKSLAEWKRLVGQTVERALELAHLTKQDVSDRMGYADQSAISRWIAGVERPLLDKLFAVDAFYDAWVIACAETNPRVEVETVIRIKRSA